MLIQVKQISFQELPIYSTNQAAILDGLIVGNSYKTPNGDLRIVVESITPVINSFSPSTATFGSGLIVRGSGLEIATSIKINGLSLTDFVILSDSAAFGTIPWGAESGLIEVDGVFSANQITIDPDNIYEFFRNFAVPEEFLFKL